VQLLTGVAIGAEIAAPMVSKSGIIIRNYGYVLIYFIKIQHFFAAKVQYLTHLRKVFLTIL
jgi:hypothetical protein